MEAFGLTTEMVVVLILLGVTVFLFVSEIVRVDVAAILIMVTLGVLSAVPGLQGLADPRHLFDGFASNAVISIIAVMIIGAGLDRTGVLSHVARWIMRVGGATETRIMLLISSIVGVISSFMQNVGAAALFLPVVSRISVRTGLPMSRLLMPMGFCAILGGTMTMVGSSPLILLNDLILTINGTLPAEQQMETFGLFDVTPVGAALVVTGLVYFTVLGRFLLPARQDAGGAEGLSVEEYINATYGIVGTIHEVPLPENHDLGGQTVDEIQRSNHLQIIAVQQGGTVIMAPPRDMVIEAPGAFAIIADAATLKQFTTKYGLAALDGLDRFSDALEPGKAGIAEVVIPPGSGMIGETGRSSWLRKVYGLAPLAIYRGGETLSSDQEDIGEIPYLAGDTLVCHTPWDALVRLEKNRDFVVVTSDFPHEELVPQKVGWALFFFAIALGLVLFSDLRLSICLLVGATGMIVSRVLTIDDAYSAVSWSTVFLLASLIPLGVAVQSTGTAEWIAQQVLKLLGDAPIWVSQAAIAGLATVFTLLMSNVGATVLLVPLAVNIAIGLGADPALFAITVALATSNSFLIPTHQVNALIMGPGGYSVTDFSKVGGVMTLLFLIVLVIAV
ncbi:SLC13 family permease [Ruegeria sp. Ofav3-42]|uniref:SLC13 family permease n=1 Tax=Ruegeria sp. Ofav3-42 TaxID=2917759 RepID=UPI001EF44BE4|nr:SLC13 family permease [Ruegeria sp. Ofav3-42]MCG7520766.1 SLC13 family permease [Ruegeria sp. Ofav3-42]